MNKTRVYLRKDCWYDLFTLTTKKLKVDKEKSDILWSMKPDERHTLFIYGRECKESRYSKSYGKSYEYSGRTSKAEKMPEIFEPYLNFFSEKYNCNFNMVLMNWYENGSHKIGMHSDDEKQITKGTPVITISCGATRKFNIYSKDGEEKITIPFEDNQVIVMGGNFQKYYKHGIPEEKKILDKRLSITLRDFA